MEKRKKRMVFTLLALVSLIVITMGVTYAFFNYAKEGSTENSVTTGTITFLYTEVSGVGRGISISDAYPISDTVGKAQTGEGNVFDFKVTSTTPNKTSIPYEVTARQKSDSTLDESAVKLYLTKVTGEVEEEVLLDNYSNLTQTTKVDSATYTEKTIYEGKVPSNSTSYEQAFRLRMWIDEDTNFSPNSDGTYPYNGKTFTVTVNVYANAKVVTDSDIALESNANISSLSVGDTVLTPIDGKDYDYETTLPEGTTNTIINVETENPYATVSIERIDSLAYQESNIKKLSTKKTLELNPGDNYFKVTVTSENKEVVKEYKIKISVEQPKILLKDEILRVNQLIEAEPTLTTSSNNSSDASGLYKSTATNDGSPTYYFRGNVENNYVSFAGQTWRVVRINEDGTIRLIMQDGINNSTTYAFNSNKENKAYMYYSNSEAKTQLETWYQKNIASNTKYASKVAQGNYFCEQAKVYKSTGYYSSLTGTPMSIYTEYSPDFKCSTDGNGYGIINSNVGLITYDESIYAGGYYDEENKKYYLYNGYSYWTMSPAGYNGGWDAVWEIQSTGMVHDNVTLLLDSKTYLQKIVPVVNLISNVTVTGLGTSTDPYVVDGINDSDADNESYINCAKENVTCTLPSGNYTVRYGANGQYYYLYHQSGSINCNSATFGGDPIFGVTKSCDYKSEK